MAEDLENHALPTWLNSNGEVTAQTIITSTDDKKRCEIIYRNKIIPVLLIPGIMGSNLKFTEDIDGNNKDDPAWSPPNGAVEGANAVGVWEKRTPAQRQTILNPATTTVHNTDRIKFPNTNVVDYKKYNNRKDLIDAKLAVYRDQRVWGELHQDSYGDFLVWLEDNLNREPMPGRPNWEQELLSEITGHGGDEKNPPTEKSHVEYATCYRYPVYAYGYNWLESNSVSAEKMDMRIEKILLDCQKQDPSCKQVILVTHSMGGLVARAYTNQSIQSNENVLGVVHGVMPATGAPVFYKRMRVGFGGENEAGKLMRSANKLVTGHVDPVAILLGPDAAATAAVVASSPGALELAPWGNYNNGKPWLRVVNSAGKELFAVGGESVYDDVYANTTAWYGMLPLRPEEIDKVTGNNIRYDPAGLVKKANVNLSLSEAFNHRIKYARHFHNAHANYYPNPRIVIWGENEKIHPTYHECVWEGAIPSEVNSATLSAAHLVEDDLKGTLTLNAGGKVFTLTLRKATGQGEGTVPIDSAMAATGNSESKDGLLAAFKQPKFDHQGCYNDPHARWATLYSIVQLTQKDIRAQC